MSERPRRPITLMGFGLGGFADGIVFHQILQWHHLVIEYRSAGDLSGLEHNTFWDGIFHLGSWVTVVVAVFWLFSARGDLARLGRQNVVGYLLVGWGIFNIVDQVVFHMLLGAHHIRMVDNYLVYDLTYTAIGAVFVAVGLLLARHREPAIGGR